MKTKHTHEGGDDEMPEIDFSQFKILRRGPDRERKFSLALLREICDLTQTEVADRAKIAQSEVSRAEQRDDCLISTLERYVRALGGELAIAVKIDGRTYPVKLT